MGVPDHFSEPVHLAQAHQKEQALLTPKRLFKKNMFCIFSSHKVCDSFDYDWC
jgi:hypothetical protein